MGTGHSWYSTTVRAEKTLENGMNKKVREVYMVDATCFTEAESRVLEEVRGFYNDELMVVAMKMENISEVFHSDDEVDDRWYKFKIALVHLDEKTGKEKNTYVYMLVQSCNTDAATKSLNEHMKGTLSDYVIKSVTETDIMDLFTYSRDHENDLTR